MAGVPTYLLEIEPLDGEERIITVTDGNLDPARVWAVVQIGARGAVIVDNGYRSREEAASAWPSAK